MQDREASGHDEVQDVDLPPVPDAARSEEVTAPLESPDGEETPELGTEVVASKKLMAVPQFGAFGALSSTLEQWNRNSSLFAEARKTLAFQESPGFRAVLNRMASDFRTLDKLTASSELLRARSVAAMWTQQRLGAGALTSWRTALETQASVGRKFTAIADMQWAHSGWLDDLSRLTAAQVRLTDWVVQQDATSRLLGELSGRPLGLWRDYVDDLPLEPGPRVLRASVITGNAGLGLLGADILESGAQDDELMHLAVQRVEADVLVPSEQGRMRAATELYAKLGEIDPTVPELLAGAWEEIERNGSAAASKAAHCIVEVLDRTLRAAAPDDTVRAWHTATGRPASEWQGRDKPPRALRVKYLAQQVGGAKQVVVAQYESLTILLTPLHGRLEGIKHASTADVATVRSLLLVAESFLAMLFLNEVSLYPNYGRRTPATDAYGNRAIGLGRLSCRPGRGRSG